MDRLWCDADNRITSSYYRGGAVTSNGPSFISGTTQCHYLAQSQGVVTDVGTTIQILNNITVSSSFCNSDSGSIITLNGNNYLGSGVGQKYNATNNGIIYVNGAGVAYLPGTTAGAGTNCGVSPYGLYA
jgi:hypothetical protein